MFKVLSVSAPWSARMLVRRIGGWADDKGLPRCRHPYDQASWDAVDAIRRKQKEPGGHDGVCVDQHREGVVVRSRDLGTASLNTATVNHPALSF